MQIGADLTSSKMVVVAEEAIKIDLWGQSLGDDSLALSISRLRQNVVVLDIGRNKADLMTAKAVGEHLSFNKNLTELRLWGNRMGEASAKILNEAMVKVSVDANGNDT